MRLISYIIFCVCHTQPFLVLISLWTSQYLMFSKSCDHGNGSVLLFKETWPLHFHRKKPVKNIPCVTFSGARCVMFWNLSHNFKACDVFQHAVLLLQGRWQLCWVFFLPIFFNTTLCVGGKLNGCGWKERIRVLSILPGGRPCGFLYNLFFHLI